MYYGISLDQPSSSPPNADKKQKINGHHAEMVLGARTEIENFSSTYLMAKIMFQFQIGNLNFYR